MHKNPGQYYDFISSGYAALHGEEQEEKLECIIELLKKDSTLTLESGTFLLDIGCGTGISTTNVPYHRAGLDPAIGSLIQANVQRKRLVDETTQGEVTTDLNQTGKSHLGYIRGVAEALPIKTKSCSVVISVTAVHNFFKIESGIQEISRITKTRAVITVLRRSKKYDDIIRIIKQNFEVLETIENEFDTILYLAPKN